MQRSKVEEILVASVGVGLGLFLFFMMTSCDKLEQLPDVDATSNEPNELSVSLVNLNNESGLHSYEYNCTSDTNELKLGAPFESGTMHITIKDDIGNLIYHETLNSINGEKHTLVGAAGTWDVDLQLYSVTGTIGLSLQPLE